MSRVYSRLHDLGVIKYDTVSGGGMIELTVVGSEVCKQIELHEERRRG